MAADANLVSSLSELLDAAAGLPPLRSPRIDVRTRAHPFADVRVLFGDVHDAALARASRALADHPAVATVRRRGGTVSLRLHDAYVAELGEQFVGGLPAGLGTSDLLAGRSFLVGFVSPNTSKALHVGHLRNVSVGHALASALTAAGAHVVTQSLVSDIGRSVAEAMAGFLLHGERDVGGVGIKRDQFVGRCHGAYMRERGEARPDPAGAADPGAREARTASDSADALLARWMAGDPSVHRTWALLRSWVLGGHRDTLRRLGVVIRREDFESEALDEAHAFVARGLAAGVLERREDGAVVYETGRPELPQLVLLRADGFPTQHTRMIGVYERTLRTCTPGCTYVDVCGSEWEPSYRVHLGLMDRLRSVPASGVLVPYHHGMVVFGGAKVSSSHGAPPLLDDLLDWVAASREVADLDEGEATLDRRQTLAAMIVKGFFLLRPIGSTLAFTRAAVLDPRRNPGLGVAGAWCRAARAVRAARLPDPADPAERLAVLRSQAFRGLVARAVARLDLGGLGAFAVATGERAGAAGAVAALSRPVLDAALESLGLAPTRIGGQQQPSSSR